MIRLKDFRDDDLWSLFEASASGDLTAVKRLVEACTNAATTAVLLLCLRSALAGWLRLIMRRGEP
jgi:hypothetical protein